MGRIVELMAGCLAMPCVIVGLSAAASAQTPLSTSASSGRQLIRAAYIPLADHYAGIVAFERYRERMKHADYRICRMKSWPLLRAYFMSGRAELAYIICPQAMDMFRERPDFRWVSLMHRDGNALAINGLLNHEVQVPESRLLRKPGAKIARGFAAAKLSSGRPLQCGVPHLQATHTVILYKFLKDHGMTLGLGRGRTRDVIAIEVAPPRSPAFLKMSSSRGVSAAFEQSLPWAEVVETRNLGRIAWYSKDVLPWPNGHVECIAIASDTCIERKFAALKEVIYYVHKAGMDIEEARAKGGAAVLEIARMIRKHIPEHDEAAIVQSLRADLMVINYRHLNLDRAGLEQIMNLAVEAGILRRKIKIDEFADPRFATTLTDGELSLQRSARPAK